MPPLGTAHEPISINAGCFSFSLKGMRCQLYSFVSRTELLMQKLEDGIVSWLAVGGAMLAPNASTTHDSPSTPIGSIGAISEVSRTPLQLVRNAELEGNAIWPYPTRRQGPPLASARTSPASCAMPPPRSMRRLGRTSEGLFATDLNTSESDRELANAVALCLRRSLPQRSQP
ncbi:hypothetical protein V8D89_006037 [Ganoderma adspersum]